VGARKKTMCCTVKEIGGIYYVTVSYSSVFSRCNFYKIILKVVFCFRDKV